MEIGFKNTESCTEIIIEQTDSDYPIPYTYLADVNQGFFTALMNRKYTSTFKLTYYNKNGKNEGEPFTIDLRNEFSRELDLDLLVTDNALKYEFKEDAIVGNIYYTLTSIDKYTIVNNGNLQDTTGSINIRNIPKGTYVFTIIPQNLRNSIFIVFVSVGILIEFSYLEYPTNMPTYTKSNSCNQLIHVIAH